MIYDWFCLVDNELLVILRYKFYCAINIIKIAFDETVGYFDWLLLCMLRQCYGLWDLHMQSCCLCKIISNNCRNNVSYILHWLSIGSHILYTRFKITLMEIGLFYYCWLVSYTVCLLDTLPALKKYSHTYYLFISFSYRFSYH
jgi:hypothetical protein